MLFVLVGLGLISPAYWCHSLPNLRVVPHWNCDTSLTLIFLRILS